MKTIRYAILVILFLTNVACHSSGNESTDYSFEILVVDKHPYFKDHHRKLVLRENGHVVDSAELYPDAGSGVDLFVFRSESGVVVIDGNGVWYKVEKGEISPKGWNWNKEPPVGEISQFSLDHAKMVYVEKKVDGVHLDNIYQYKDPPGKM